MIKRKLWIIIGIMVLIVGGAIALTTLTDSIKIEKVNDTYSIYVLKEQKTGTEIQEELTKLNSEKQFYSTDIYQSCVLGCPDWCKLEAEMLNITYNPECVEECSSMCELERDYLMKVTDDKINELNVILKAK